MTSPKITASRALILKSLADEIGAVAGHADHLKELLVRYRTEQGLKLSFVGGTHVARMRGVSATATMGEVQALEGWARAARRALLNGGHA